MRPRKGTGRELSLSYCGASLLSFIVGDSSSKGLTRRRDVDCRAAFTELMFASLINLLREASPASYPARPCRRLSKPNWMESEITSS